MRDKYQSLLKGMCPNLLFQNKGLDDLLVTLKLETNGKTKQQNERDVLIFR